MWIDRLQLKGVVCVIVLMWIGLKVTDREKTERRREERRRFSQLLRGTGDNVTLANLFVVLHRSASLWLLGWANHVPRITDGPAWGNADSGGT
jgi:hypothetical protein